VGKVKGVTATNAVKAHQDVHLTAGDLRKAYPAKYASLAGLFSAISDLAKVNTDEAFAEGYVFSLQNPFDVRSITLQRFVSRYAR
jgi:Fe-S cluster assembly ATPase SufC